VRRFEVSEVFVSMFLCFYERVLKNRICSVRIQKLTIKQGGNVLSNFIDHDCSNSITPELLSCHR
jgi:hypothetical protein